MTADEGIVIISVVASRKRERKRREERSAPLASEPFTHVARHAGASLIEEVPSSGLEPPRPYGHRPSTCCVYHSATRAS